MLTFNEDSNTIICSATLNTAYKAFQKNSKGQPEKDKPKKNTINIIPEDAVMFYETIAPVFADAGKKFIPDWYKKGENVILKSTYDYKVMLPDESKITFTEYLERGLIKGAKVTVRCLMKTDEDGNYLGVIYPLAMRVYEDGEEFDQFEGM